MYIAKRMPFRIVAPFAWRAVLFFALYSFSLCALYTWAGWTLLAIPFLPVIAIGIAVAIYIVVKNYSSYERLREARGIWESLINASRSWGILVMDYIVGFEMSGSYSKSKLYGIKQILIYRHIAYLNALRIQLRSNPCAPPDSNGGLNTAANYQGFNQGQLDKELSLFLDDDEVEFFVNRQNPATQIIKCQSQQLKELHTAGLLSDCHHIDMERLLIELYAHQGAAERVKSFPFPRKYAYLSNVVVVLFVAILPFGLLTEMGQLSSWQVWLTVPLYTIIAWVFYAMEITEDADANPFDSSLNDVPITAICRSIEIDLREMLGETELPQQIQPVDNILT